MLLTLNCSLLIMLHNVYLQCCLLVFECQEFLLKDPASHPHSISSKQFSQPSVKIDLGLESSQLIKKQKQQKGLVNRPRRRELYQVI